MDDSQRRSLGAVVKTLREAQGLSREELVARTHTDASERISVEMLSKVEQGRRAPSAKSLRKLAHALGIEPNALVTSAAAWEEGSANGVHLAALRSSILGVAGMAAGLGTALGSYSQPAKFGAAALIGRLVPTPVLAASAVAGVVGREMTQRKDVIDAMRQRLAELEASSATDEQLVEASLVLDAVVAAATSDERES